MILLLCSIVFGADSKVTDMNELTDVAGTDLLYVIDNPGGTPESKKITVLNLFDMIDTSAELISIVGDETGTGYLVFNTAPSFVTSITLGTTLITEPNVTNWNTAYGWGDWSGEGFLTSYSETDPCFALSDVNDVNSTDISNWNTAYGWGDWSGEGFLTSYSETDPCFALSDANDITTADKTNWDTAYGWGDWSGEGFLTAETDPCFTAWYSATNFLQLQVGIEPNDIVMIDSNSVLVQKLKHINITMTSPADIVCADMIPIWHNTSGYTFNIVEIKAWSDSDNVSLELEEIPSETDFSSPTQTQAIEIATDGTDCFYFVDTTITNPVIETGHLLAIDFDTTDDPNYVKLTITGYYED